MFGLAPVIRYVTTDLNAGLDLNGKHLPLHDERWDAAVKYGSIGWHTIRHTYKSWLVCHRGTYRRAAETYAARPNLDHDERVRQRADGSKTQGKRSCREQDFEER